MKTITAKELKNKTGEVIKRVRRGETVLVSYRGKPLARVSPIKGASIVEDLSGLIAPCDKDAKDIKDERLAKKYEGVY
jgi:prevent-host-death family protein